MKLFSFNIQICGKTSERKTSKKVQPQKGILYWWEPQSEGRQIKQALQRQICGGCGQQTKDSWSMDDSQGACSGGDWPQVPPPNTSSIQFSIRCFYYIDDPLSYKHKYSGVALLHHGKRLHAVLSMCTVSKSKQGGQATNLQSVVGVFKWCLLWLFTGSHICQQQRRFLRRTWPSCHHLRESPW